MAGSRTAGRKLARGAAAALALAAALVVAPAGAQQQASDKAAAEAAFQEGQQAMAQGDLVRACTRFADSQRAEPAPGTLFFLAECEEKRGRIATAWALFRELEQKLPDSDPRKPNVMQRASALGPRVKRLTIRLAADSPSGAKVTRDGVPATVGSPVPIDPGSHVIVIEARGRKPAETRVEIGDADREVVVSVGAVDESAKGDGIVGVQVPVGITIGSVGVAAVIAGVVVGALGKVRYDESADGCDSEDVCTDEAIIIRDEGRTLGDVGTIVFFVGVGLVATGAVVWLTAPSGEGGLLASAPLSIGVGPSALVVRSTW